MRSTCGATDIRPTGKWVCIEEGPHTAGQHYFVNLEPKVVGPACPDCLEGKCDICLGSALDPKTDQVVECACRAGGH